MRIPTLALPLLVLATGCATTSTTPRKTAAQRAEEIARYRERKAAEEAGVKQEQEGAEAEKPGEPTAPTASTPPATPTPPAAPGAPVALAAPQGPIGPRSGLFGIRATLLGNTLPLEEAAATNTTSALGIRFFPGDSVGVNLSAGFTYATLDKASATGLSLGLGLNFYAGAQNAQLRPFFAVEGAVARVGTKVGTVEQSASVLSLAAGAGAEYWLTPQLSVSANLMVGLASAPGEKEDEEGAFVLGTFHPGLGVTLYTN